MFRYGSQKGRYRPVSPGWGRGYGMAGPDIDAELICLSARLWRRLGLREVSLQLNTLGSSAARAAYREQLVIYFYGAAERIGRRQSAALAGQSAADSGQQEPDYAGGYRRSAGSAGSSRSRVAGPFRGTQGVAGRSRHCLSTSIPGWCAGWITAPPDRIRVGDGHSRRSGRDLRWRPL